MDNTRISGELEIDHLRGVIYFHADNEKAIKQFGTQSILRIKCPVPIPNDRQIDLIIKQDSRGFAYTGMDLRNENGS